MDGPDLLAGEGLPKLIDRYEVRSQYGSLGGRANALPTLETLFNFGPAELISS